MEQFKKDANHKVFLLIDRASFHTVATAKQSRLSHFYEMRHSKNAKAYLEKNKDWIEYEYFSTAAPDKNPTEFCWKKNKQELLQLYSFSNKKSLLDNLKKLWKSGFFTHKINNYLSL